MGMAKTVALIFGIIYTLIGVLGFFPSLGGSMSQTPSVLLTIAPVNLTHNIVHLIIGVAGLASAGDEARAATYCKVFGVVLLLIGVLGYFVPNPLGLIPIGPQDTLIHLVSGLILAFVGFRSTAGTSARA
jgi:multisubunit Na+/H+ antiporter MnhG subunit